MKTSADLVGKTVSSSTAAWILWSTMPVPKGTLAHGTDENKAALVSTVPVKRTATPEEIAHVIVFVGSTKVSYMTGASIAVDGGMLAG